jgi:hypothetical protein
MHILEIYYIMLYQVHLTMVQSLKLHTVSCTGCIDRYISNYNIDHNSPFNGITKGSHELIQLIIIINR